MPYSIRLFLFLLVVIGANIMQTITGFAGTVLAMPFSILLIGSDLSRIILNILGILASLGVVILNKSHINWKEVLKICLTMLVGMVGGYLILGLVDISKQVLLLILAGFVLLFTIIGIYTTFIRKQGLEEKLYVSKDNELNDSQSTTLNMNNMTIHVSPYNTEESKEEEHPVKQESSMFKDPWYKEVLFYGLLLIAGVVHGMYVCGGPLLIIYATKKLKDKDEFRSTLSMCWVALNGVNLIRDIVAGSFGNINWTIEAIAAMVMSVFMLITAIAIGSMLAKRLNKRKFMIITYVLMGISAVSLILNAFGVI